MDSNDTIESLSRQAIEAALSYNWDDAIAFNKQIIKEKPEDVDSLNRLARALFEQGKYPQAKKLYQTVLEIDPYNVIAQKNLKKVSAFKKEAIIPTNGVHHAALSPAMFLEEAGVTKVINLVKLAEPQKISLLSAGELVNLTVKNRGITVTDENNNYLGVLPDDLSHLLLKLIKGGNKYVALIKSIKPNSLAILIRETFRSKKFRNQPSFIADSKVVSYSSDHITITDDDDAPTEDAAEGDDAYSA